MFEVVFDLVGGVPIGARLAEALGEIGVPLLGFENGQRLLVHPGVLPVGLHRRGGTAVVAGVVQRPIDRPARVEDRRLRKWLVAKRLQHRVDPVSPKRVLVVAFEGSLLGLVQLLELLEDPFRLGVAVPRL